MEMLERLLRYLTVEEVVVEEIFKIFGC